MSKSRVCCVFPRRGGGFFGNDLALNVRGVPAPDLIESSNLTFTLILTDLSQAKPNARQTSRPEFEFPWGESIMSSKFWHGGDALECTMYADSMNATVLE